MRISKIMVAGIVLVLLFCTAAGCTGIATKKSQPADSAQDSRRGLDGGSGGVSAATSGSYPQNSYFTFDCTGEWKSSTDPGWKNHHGSFTLTGSVPFPITYDFNNPARYALYTATDTAGSGMSSSLQVRESHPIAQELRMTANPATSFLTEISMPAG